jgi:hypothetical protein
MQQVLISKIKVIINDAFKDSIFVQLIITSHSSHILSEAGIDKEKGFRRLRYFNRIENIIEVKDFNSLEILDEKKTTRFLRQYLTLHKSDLFFSDKVIIVEGTTERMLMPQMIRKVVPHLATQYVTVLEVGGAYTHKFKEVLEFLNLKTLVITDIDSINAEGVRCPVSKGENSETTSNQTLKSWIPKKEYIVELIGATDIEKTESKIIRVAYQTEENGFIGRSFEEAFLITNKTLLTTPIDDGEGGKFKLTKEFSLFVKKGFDSLDTESPYDLAPTSSSAKTNFAFDAMAFPEENGAWKVPKYIMEGLIWLVEPIVTNNEVQTTEILDNQTEAK